MAATLLATAAKSVGGPGSTLTQAVEALPSIPTNLSSPERWVSLIAGGAVAIYGLTEKEPSILTTAIGGYLMYRGLSGNCPAYQALNVSTADSTAPNTAVAAGHGTRVEATVVVNKSTLETYDFWRDFERLPKFMDHLLNVETTNDGRSHWVAKGPLGLRVEWDAKIIRDEPGKAIAWQSLPGADVDNAGSVHFRAVQAGTEVRVNLKYDPPGGQLGTAVAKLFGENPQRQVSEDLLRFKKLIESSGLPSKIVGLK